MSGTKSEIAFAGKWPWCYSRITERWNRMGLDRVPVFLRSLIATAMRCRSASTTRDSVSDLLSFSMVSVESVEWQVIWELADMRRYTSNKWCNCRNVVILHSGQTWVVNNVSKGFCIPLAISSPNFFHLKQKTFTLARCTYSCCRWTLQLTSSSSQALTRGYLRLSRRGSSLCSTQQHNQLMANSTLASLVDCWTQR